MDKVGFKVIGTVLALALMGFFVQAAAFEAQTSNANAVRVDVRPIQLAAGKTAIFEVRMNTHSVDLSYDMAKACVLQDDSGKKYQAVKWEGSPPGGHHRTGKLEFPRLEGTPKSVKLIIKDVSEVPERSFEWKISS